jgi:hypothetical protein
VCECECGKKLHPPGSSAHAQLSTSQTRVGTTHDAARACFSAVVDYCRADEGVSYSVVIVTTFVSMFTEARRRGVAASAEAPAEQCAVYSR